MIKKMEDFISKMHLLSLAVIYENAPYIANAFYAYDNLNLIIASSSKTTHIKALKTSNKVAVTIALDTKIVGKIKGVQILGIMRKATKKESLIYFKSYPYATVLKPQIWAIEIQKAKFTDNSLGFGKKFIWKRDLA